MGSSANALAPPTATNKARQQQAHPPPPVLEVAAGALVGAAAPLPGASLRAAEVSRGLTAPSCPPASCSSGTPGWRCGVTAAGSCGVTAAGSGRRAGGGSLVAGVESCGVESCGCSGSTSLHFMAGRGIHTCPSNQCHVHRLSDGSRSGSRSSMKPCCVPSAPSGCTNLQAEAGGVTYGSRIVCRVACVPCGLCVWDDGAHQHSPMKTSHLFGCFVCRHASSPPAVVSRL